MIFLLISFNSFGQIGGESTYQFLSLSNSARVAALGGIQVAIQDSTDLGLPFFNPALLRSSMNNHLIFSYINYISDINYGYASYAHSLGKYGTLAGGVHYINYGNFTEADEDGNITGSHFSAGEYSLNIIWSNYYRHIWYGVTLKPVYSVFESYRSLGIAGDAGIAWTSKNNLTTLGMVARNFGTQITTYYESGEREPIPFDLMAGISRKLAHAPVTFCLTAHHLNHWVLAKPEEDQEENTSDPFLPPAESLGKQAMRHLLAGLEVYPSKHFTLRAGYNYQLRQELKVEQKLSTVGFSLGFGINVKRFRLDYSNVRYHVAGTSNLLSLTVNLNQNNF